MKRLATGLAISAVLAASCSSSGGTDEIFDELGLSEDETACFETEFDDRGLDLDSVLTATRDELSSDELQTVLDISAACTSDERTAATDEPATDNDNDDANDNDKANEDGENSPRLDPELNEFEQAFVDGLVESGGTLEVALCLLTEFDAAGIEILDLAEFGLMGGAEPTSEMMAAVFRCGDEIADSGAFDATNLFGGGSGDTYGDDPVLDALWDDCAAGDLTACDALWLSSPVDSTYEAFGSTCGDTTSDRYGNCAEDTETATRDTYGDDPVLDALWDDCAAGDLTACDALWLSSPVDSTYEAFGSTCGDRSPEQAYGTCETTLGS